MRHLMVDLEALRLTQLHMAPLMNIGCVVFDENAEVISELDIYIKPEYQPDCVVPEPETLKWWMTQPSWDTLKNSMEYQGTNPEAALAKLMDFYINNHCETIWYNGPMYDGLILRAYFERSQWDEPWKYNAVRDLRTIRQQYKDLLDEKHERREVTHLGLQDSLDQVSMLRCISQYTNHQWA